MRRKDGGRAVAKADLPQKMCLGCGRPFTWRKKWERDWDSVRYCSERCRRAKAPAGMAICRQDPD